MQYKKINLKFIINLLFIICFNLYSQNDNRVRIDGVSAVVGDYVILNSDIDKAFLEMESEGISLIGVSRCDILEKLMKDKLYTHHAIQDSIEVSDSEIYDYVDQSINFFSEQLGSLEKALEFYNKTDEATFRDELFKLNKEQKLSSLMQSEIVEKVEITPEEVKQFFESIPKSQIPVFGTELEIAQIVIEPKVSDEEKDNVINQLKSFKIDVEEKGLSFGSKAILYSQDPGSRSNGGKYTLHRKKPRMYREFRDVAFSLRENEISDPFETESGWHIIKVDKIRGQEIDIRHILLIPKVDPLMLTESKKILDTLRKRIIEEEITFNDAAINFSSEKQTRNNGGLLINPTNGTTRFELTKMDPLLYNQVRDLKDNEISLPLLDQDRSGKKKYKILKVTNRYDEHKADFSRDYTKIMELALKEKKINVIQDWIKTKILDTYISLNSQVDNCSFKENWKKEIIQ